MLSYILYALLILDCVVLIVAVLLQPGKADAGALFTSSVSSTAFGPRGTATILSKITIGAAIGFMLLSLMLSMNIGTPTSYMEGVSGEAPAPQTTPATETAPAPQQAGEAAPPATTAEPAGATASPAATDTNTNGGTNANAPASASPASSPQGQQSPAR